MKNIFDDVTLRYHGIGENILKFIFILKDGILCANSLEHKPYYARNYGGFNKDEAVSICYPINGSRTTYGAFQIYIKKGGLSFVLKDVKESLLIFTGHKSGFADEELYIGNISPNNIVGIIVNSQLLNKKISELNLLKNMGYGYINNTFLQTIRYLKSDGMNNIITEEQMQELFDKTDQLMHKAFLNFQLEEQIILELSQILSSYLAQYFEQKYGITTVVEFLQMFNKNNLPIYDENGEILDINNIKVTNNNLKR